MSPPAGRERLRSTVTSRPEALIEVLTARGIEARVAGRLEAGSTIRIASQGELAHGRELTFEVDEPA